MINNKKELNFDDVSEILKEFNNIANEKETKNNKNIKRIVKTLGDFKISPPFFCESNLLQIGNNVTIEAGCIVINRYAKITIGNNVTIEKNVQLVTCDHSRDSKVRFEQNLCIWKEVIIEDNVHIGENSIILPGVTIGKNAVIAPNSLVNKSIPANVMAGGITCKVLKELT